MVVITMFSLEQTMGCRGCDCMVVGLTNVVSSNHTHDKLYSMQQGLKVGR
jgi:hypothetical protein